MQNMRVTLAVATLLRVFLEDPVEPRYGYDLMRQTGFPSGKLYPILARLEAAGWLVKELEAVDPAAVGRPARRHYRLSGDAVAAARHELALVNAQLQPRSTTGSAPRPAAGTT
jgi:PadR family transcriptional regulator, regulatory protein PadR